jgi:hypothetical protein
MCPCKGVSDLSGWNRGLDVDNHISTGQDSHVFR